MYKGELMHSEAGSSHRGYANDHLISPGGVMPIAIKTLKANASVKTQQDFRREVELMSELRHPNIVNIWLIYRKCQTVIKQFLFSRYVY